MIGSVSDFQRDIAEQERRRQQIAASRADIVSSAAPRSPAVAAPFAAPFAAGVPAAEYGPPPAALKTGAPDVAKPGKRLPPVPKPEPEHVEWAKRIMRDGHQSSVKDRVDAGRILDAAGLNPADFHGGREPDSAPPGARDVAAAHLAREQAETDRNAQKNYHDRGSELGPAEGREPGRPAPENFDRDYLSERHAAEAPMSEGPRQSPFMHAPQGYPQPIALSSQTVAVNVPAHATQALSMGSPSDK